MLRDERLRVLIANERHDCVEFLAQLVSELGHDVIAREIDVGQVGRLVARVRPDVAVVGLGLNADHTLHMISEIARDATCPVIAVRQVDDPEFVRQAARRGVFAYVLRENPAELQSAIDIAIARFAEYHSLQGAFGRRAAIEQAKGILMARHSIGPDEAFDMLRLRSHASGRRLADLAQAVVDSQLLLLPDYAHRFRTSRSKSGERPVAERARPAESA